MSEQDRPTSAVEARRRLEAGNRTFVESESGGPKGTVSPQEPFAAVLGCADARAPVEQLFGQGWNDVFVVRVAGNGLNAEGLGSLQYAAANLASIQVVAVLGHTACGAVTVAVDAWLDPSNYPTIVPTPELRAIGRDLFVATRAAVEFLRESHGASVVDRPGYRAALIETTVAVHAATTARMVREQLHELKPGLDVAFGVYDIAGCNVGLTTDAPGLTDAPADADAFDAIGRQVAESRMVAKLLDG